MSRICMPEDNGSHSPPTDDINWQESFFLSWYDACSGSGGYHHVDFQPFRKRACVWSWIAAGRRVVSRFQSLNLPFPEGDLGDRQAPRHQRVSKRAGVAGVVQRHHRHHLQLPDLIQNLLLLLHVSAAATRQIPREIGRTT